MGEKLDLKFDKKHLYGLGAGLLAALLLYLGWYHYRDFLEQGRRPSLGTRILSDLEANGFPDLSFETTEGLKANISQLTGEVILVNYWASWCEPCIHEFPSMLALLKRFEGRINLVAISADSQRKDLDAFLKLFLKNPITELSIVWDPERELSFPVGVESLPETFIVRRKDLSLVRKVSGTEVWDTDEAISFFQSLLETKPTQNR